MIAQLIAANLGLFRVFGVIGAAASVVLLGIVFAGPDRAVERDIRGRLGSYAQLGERSSWLARIPLLRRFALEAEEAARRRGVLSAVTSLLEQANIPMSAGEAMLAAAAAAVAAGAVAGAITANVVTAALVVIIGLLLVVYGLRLAARRERIRFESQLPDTLNLLGTSLRAGYSLLQAVEAVSREAAEPTRREFGRAISEIRLGQSVTGALRGVVSRMGSTDFAWVVMAVDIQREVGGNLAEVLQTASETLVERNRLHREARALTAEGRISAAILVAVPVVLFLFIFFTNRDYLDPLLDNNWGRLALAGAMGLLLAGVYWMRRIIEIDV